MSTKRRIVTSVKDYVVWQSAATLSVAAMNTVVDEPTENQEAGIELSSAALGFVVMRAVKPKTDQMINSVIDWRKNRKVAETPAV